MAAQIRPTRLEVSDRFPILGFTVRTDGTPQRIEIAIATDPQYFRSDQKPNRTSGNFFSTRGGAPLMAQRGEAVYLVPPQVLSRFIGKERLYFALATTPDRRDAVPEISMMPSVASPYISIKSLTGRSLRRVRVVPSRQERAAGYGSNGQSLEWAGDTARPGMEPAAPTSAAGNGTTNGQHMTNGAAQNGGAKNGTMPAQQGPTPAKPVDYDDGFGPMRPAAGGSNGQLTQAAPPASSGGTQMPAAQALDLGPISLGNRQPVTPPSVTRLGSWQASLVEGALAALAGPLAPMIVALPAAARAAGVSIGVGPSVGAGLVGGGGLGAGVIFGSDGGIGVYGAAEFQVGWLASISATAQITVVRGGIDSFSGWGYAAAISGGEGVVGGASALFDSNGNFQGISAQLGVGAGLSPVDVYVAVQRQISTSLGLAQAPGQMRPRRNGTVTTMSRPACSRGMDAGGPDVDVMVRMFIPSPLISGPIGLFGGDGRGFSYSGGTSRGQIHATVHMTPGGGINGIDYIDRQWGESTEYDSADGVEVAGKPDWWREKRSGASPTNRATFGVSDDNLQLYVGAPGTTRSIQAIAEQASIVTLEAIGAMPLSSVAPAIDADLTIMLRLNGGNIEAKVEGEHDGFPAYEVYVNQQRIYSYDPVAAGNDPSALFPPMDVTARSNWATVGQLTAAQALAISRALDAESFTLNWDEVELVAQPTNFSCWAAAAAMVVGWKELVSLSADGIASICSRTTATGLDPRQVERFAHEIGLDFEYPACYSVEGFRTLLENKGPLWVGAAVPSPHVVVVTGMYSDGTNTFVRISDPWDRQVGTPGSPGAYANTHASGSRYIMKWEDFVREYETAATTISDVNLQILHSGGTGNRRPNHGRPTVYAQALRTVPARAFDLPALSVSGNRQTVTPPSVTTLSTAARIAIETGLADLVGPFAPLILGLPMLARASGCSIGFGPAVGGGVGQSGGLGVGIIFGPGGEIGVYGAAEIDIGFITGISAAAQVTVVNGGIDKFNGWGMTAAITGAEGIVGGAAALFDMSGNFQGVSIQVGVGIGFSPVDFYIAIQRQTATQVMAQAQGRTSIPVSRHVVQVGRPTSYAQAVRSGVTSRALDLPALSISAQRQPVTPPSVTTLGTAARLAIEAGLAVIGGPFGILIGTLPQLARASGCSIGFGPAIRAGLGAGGSLGAGIIFGSDGNLGVYGAPEIDIGFITGINATAQITVVRGGIDKFDGWGLTATISGGEVVVGGASALFDLSGNFQGVSFQLGVGVSLSPVDFYVAIQRQVSTTLAMAQTPAVRARAFAGDGAPRRVTGSAGNISWDLVQYDGMKTPSSMVAVHVTPPRGARSLDITDWPFVPGSQGRTCLPLHFAWTYDSGSVGQLAITTGAPQESDGWALATTAEVAEGSDIAAVATLRVTVQHVFTKPGSDTATAVTELTLFGDGMFQRQDRWVGKEAAAA